MGHSASNSDGAHDDADSSSTVSESSSAAPSRTILAEVFVSHDELVLSHALQNASNVTVQRDGPLASDVFFVSVVGDDFEAFETALDADPTVREAACFTTTADKRVYRICADESATRSLPDPSELGVRVIDVQSSDGGWVVRAQLLARDPLVEFRQACVERDLTFEVRQLYEVDATADSTDVRMTGRQRDIVLTAYECGYYDVPRGISQGELAERLDVSTSAISQQLRRATGQLVASTFAVEQD